MNYLDALRPNLVPVCWSLRAERRGGGGTGQIHLSGDDGRTACGRDTGDLWDFWGHDLENGDIGPTCKICERAFKREAAKLGWTIPT